MKRKPLNKKTSVHFLLAILSLQTITCIHVDSAAARTATARQCGAGQTASLCLDLLFSSRQPVPSGPLQDERRLPFLSCSVGLCIAVAMANAAKRMPDVKKMMDKRLVCTFCLAGPFGWTSCLRASTSEGEKSPPLFHSACLSSVPVYGFEPSSPLVLTLALLPTACFPSAFFFLLCCFPRWAVHPGAELDVQCN